MKRFYALFALLLCLSATPAFALDMTPTGFYYPTGYSTWPPTGGNWLSRDAAHGGNYVDGYYHIAQDMLLAQGSQVYAISDGDVVKIFTTYAGYIYVKGVKTYSDDVDGLGSSNINGHYIANSVIFIRHTLQDGTQFLAEYMHVQPIVAEGSHVLAGHPIATVGPYQYSATHLHFGIHPSTTWPTNYWGRMPNNLWADPNGFVDPVNWITTKSPQGYSGGFDPTNPYVDSSYIGTEVGTQAQPFKTISAAVNAASALPQAVTMHVKGGHYPGPITISNKNIHIISSDGNTVTIGG